MKSLSDLFVNMDPNWIKDQLPFFFVPLFFLWAPLLFLIPLICSIPSAHFTRQTEVRGRECYGYKKKQWMVISRNRGGGGFLCLLSFSIKFCRERCIALCFPCWDLCSLPSCQYRWRGAQSCSCNHGHSLANFSWHMRQGKAMHPQMHRGCGALSTCLKPAESVGVIWECCFKQNHPAPGIHEVENKYIIDWD